MYKKMLQSLKDVSIHCNGIGKEEFNSCQYMCEKVNEIEKAYDDILEELLSLSKQGKEG